MKVANICLPLLLISGLHLCAQNPLIGTWELITTTGVNADGEKFALDTTAVREIKIITPTHYMLIAQDVAGDSLVFNRSYAGIVQVKGDQYIEKPLMSSLKIVENLEAYFTWQVKDNLFTQSGYVTRPDGKKVQVVLTFRKVSRPVAFPKNPAIGTWSVESSTYTTPDGRTFTEKAPEVTVMEIITPTHWMGISYKNNRFENAMGGTYAMSGNKIYPQTHYSVIRQDPPRELELSVKRTGDELIVNGMMINASGKRVTWEDVCKIMK